MPGQAAKVLLSERQLQIVTEFSKSNGVKGSLRLRASIIEKAFRGLNNSEISACVGLGTRQVGIWRKRWRDSWEKLCLWECQEPRRLRQAIRDLLSDAPRPGSPGTFTAEQIAEIQAVACEPPKLSGRPISHWTNVELRDEVVQRGIVSQISVSQVGRYLRNAVLQPHRQKQWINTTEKDPETFQREVEAVCETYLDAPAAFERDGTRTACIDEATGLQALERPSATMPVQPGQVARQEFEYIRHGTTTVIGNWDVVSGQLFNMSIGPTRDEADFVRHVASTIATSPQAKWRLVMDRLNIHWSASLVIWVAQALGLQEDLGEKGKSGHLKNQESRRAFLSDPSHRIQFVFLPKHSSWLNQIEVIFGIMHRKLLRRGEFKSVSELEDQLELFFHYFNETMARPFHWTYTGKPTPRLQNICFCPVHHKCRRPRKGELAKLAASSNVISALRH